MTMREVIDKVSAFYREESKKERDLQTQLNLILEALRKVNETNGEHITLLEYDDLIVRKIDINERLQSQTKYCEGISCVRELLMDLTYDAEVG